MQANPFPTHDLAELLAPLAAPPPVLEAEPLYDRDGEAEYVACAPVALGEVEVLPDDRPHGVSLADQARAWSRPGRRCGPTRATGRVLPADTPRRALEELAARWRQIAAGSAAAGLALPFGVIWGQLKAQEQCYRECAEAVERLLSGGAS